MLKGKIDVVNGFQTSVNIAFDLNDNNKISNFIPTNSALEIIEDVILSTAPNSTKRARILIGAYGRGKSHIVLVLLSLLYKKDKNLFNNLLIKSKEYNPDLYQYIYNYLSSDMKILPVIVSGNSNSLTQSFLSALKQTLSYSGLNEIMPETNFKASRNTIENWRKYYKETFNKFEDLICEPIDQYLVKLDSYDIESYEKFTELYPTLTSGSIFNPFLGVDVVEVYEKVAEKLRDKGFNGIYIIYDEFSKYLESSIGNTTISDIKLLQDLAEKCNRSGNNQIHLMLISHKEISNYIDGSLPKDKVDGWRGVSGRFIHKQLHNNFSQMYEIISDVIKKENTFWNNFINANELKFNSLAEHYSINQFLGYADNFSTKKSLVGCYPLHPISMFILPRISEKIAQNERTLFTFLASEERFTLTDYLNNTNDEFSLLTPDYLYDYFEPLMRKEPYTTTAHQIYKLSNNVLRKVEVKSLEAKIIKTIALIYIVEQYEKLSPTIDTVIDTYSDTVGGNKQVELALKALIEKQCIIYLKRSNNYLKLKESSGVDIPQEIEQTIEKIKANYSVKTILNDTNYEDFLYPTRYNDENEIIRYFNFKFIDSKEYWDTNDWTTRLKNINSDGVVLAIVPKNNEEIVAIKNDLLKININHNQILFVLPSKFFDISKVAFEYRAVSELKLLANEDEFLSDEYEIYLEDLEEVVSNYISSFTHPEYKIVNYYYRGKEYKFFRRAQLSNLLSEICDDLYPNAPIINNEAINKNYLPSVTINSRTRILNSLLSNNLDSNIGLSGSSQDVSIMRSVLIQPGILQYSDTEHIINFDINDNNLKSVLLLIKDFLVTSSENKGNNFKILYDKLIKPEYGIGLKLGVIPIYLAVVLHYYKQNLVIRYKGHEEKINSDLLNAININPENYDVIIENWNEEKTKYINSLEDIFREYVNIKERSYNNFTYLMLAMNRWYMSLPKYCKELRSVYEGQFAKEINKTSIRFLSHLKRVDNNPREFIFETLFDVFGFDDFDLSIINNISETVDLFNTALLVLIKGLIKDVKRIFENKQALNASLTSIIKDWYETLNEKTVNHVFNHNENKILNLFKDISNNEELFVRELTKLITGLRIEDWNEDSIKSFILELEMFKRKIEEFNNNVIVNKDVAINYKVVIKDESGNEIIKTFSKVDYTPRARLLLNEITNSIKEMGQSISEQEKRQVLIDILNSIS